MFFSGFFSLRCGGKAAVGIGRLLHLAALLGRVNAGLQFVLQAQTLLLEIFHEFEGPPLLLPKLNESVPYGQHFLPHLMGLMGIARNEMIVVPREGGAEAVPLFETFGLADASGSRALLPHERRASDGARLG